MNPSTALPFANSPPGTVDCSGDLKIEDCPNGYPRFSALIGSHPSFHVFRRFIQLRSRLLLQKQDHLCDLEERLRKIDREEPRPFFLGTLRRDQNTERLQLLRECDKKLEEYDELLQRNEQAIARATAQSRHVHSLQNWIENTGSIARDETKYLEYAQDLAAVGSFGSDIAHEALQAPVEDALIWCSTLMKKSLGRRPSQDPNIHIFRANIVPDLIRATAALALIAVLLTPIAIGSCVQGIPAHLATIMLACTVFIFGLSLFLRMRTSELFVAGATYAAVLVVFISGNSN